MPRCWGFVLLGAFVAALPTEASDLYWTEFQTGGISRANTDTLVREPVIPSGLPRPYRIAVDPVENKVYWTSTAVDGGLRRANLDGTNVQTIVPGGSAPFLGLTIDVGRRQVIWSYGTQLRHANLNGTNVQTYDAVTGSEYIQDVVIDEPTGNLYFSDAGFSRPGTIRRMNVDGTGLSTIVPSVPNGAYGLAIDPPNDALYWGRFVLGAGLGGVERATLDGGGAHTIVSGVDVDSMAIDPANHRLYWSTTNDNVTEGAIWRSELDGSDAGILPLTGFVPGGITVIPEPTSLVLIALGAAALRKR